MVLDATFSHCLIESVNRGLAGFAKPPTKPNHFVRPRNIYLRDVMTRLMYGARISITIGILTTLIAFLIGVTYGSIAGYMGGRVDNIMMRIVDIIYALPYMFLVIILVTILGKSLPLLFVALGFVGWYSVRVARRDWEIVAASGLLVMTLFGISGYYYSLLILLAPLMLPIDHCLLRGGVAVRRRRTRAACGSDHLSLVVDLVLVDD